MPSPRSWISLGSTFVDLNSVVKIDIERTEARLYAISGEALIMTAWTDERSDVARLKTLASIANGWVEVKSETDPNPKPAGRQHVKLAAVDKLVVTESTNGLCGELFANEVFLGHVGEESTEAIKISLGISS
jgi:hypothetical protein